jgi:UDP-N-acetylmuramoylalanine--D-glutamate ligase
MKRTLVIGAGKSGVAAANYIAARGDGVLLADSKAQPDLPYELDSKVLRAFGRDDEALLEDVGEIVLSPGVPATIPLLQKGAARGIPVISEVELAYRAVVTTPASRASQIIAVTGSNGKSTTTALIGEILRVAGRQPIVAGNIGEPFVRSIDLEKPRVYVLELSSFQLETIDTFRANVALLLNVTPDHMDRYPSFEAYAAAKLRIFDNQQQGDTAIVNAGEKREDARRPGVKMWRFSAAGPLDQGAYLDGDRLVMRIEGNESSIPRSALKLAGLANVENALAAWLAARAVGVKDGDVQTAFGSFAGLPHRMVVVRERNGVRWINDSKGTNVDATLKSLEGFPPSSVWLILGGKDKAGEFERMRALVGEKTRAVLTIGKAAGRIAEALEGAATIVPLGDMEHAVRWAGEHAGKGDSVLLSPACASFDQYRNFEHRGEHFEELVKKL